MYVFVHINKRKIFVYVIKESVLFFFLPSQMLACKSLYLMHLYACCIRSLLLGSSIDPVFHYLLECLRHRVSEETCMREAQRHIRVCHHLVDEALFCIARLHSHHVWIFVGRHVDNVAVGILFREVELCCW